MPGPSSSTCSSTVSWFCVSVMMMRAAARREAGGVLQDVLQHRLQHALGRAHDHRVVEPADQADVAARRDLAEVERRLADQLGEVGRHARRLDQVGGAGVEALRGVDQREQPGDRGIDDLERAPRALVLERHRLAHRRQRGLDGRERRLEGMGVVLGGLADLLRQVLEVEHQLVEVARHARQLGHDVALREGVVADAALADLVGDLAEAAQAEEDADRRQHGEDRQHQVDAGCDPDRARLPVGPADRGVEEFRGGVGRGQHPAAARRS